MNPVLTSVKAIARSIRVERMHFTGGKEKGGPGGNEQKIRFSASSISERKEKLVRERKKEELAMKSQISKIGFVVAMGAWLCFLSVQATFGDVIAFEWKPSTNSGSMSLHGVGGPVLADDFKPAVSGWVTRVEWWGNQAASPDWEITFHDDAGGVPAAQLPSGGIAQHTVTSWWGVPDPNGVFGYSAAWAPQDVYVNTGTDYWFSVANIASGWTWALPLAPSPTVGSEMYHAARSVGIGPNGGPHFGPWDQYCDENFAFRIWVVPEPCTLGLLALGFFITTARRR